MQTKKVVVFPVDGYLNVGTLVAKLESVMRSEMVRQLIGTIKFNDALHFPGYGPVILEIVTEIVPEGTKKMIDLKIADVSDTNKFTLRHYYPFSPDIVTVTSTVSAKSLSVIKETLPDTKIAIVDTLTDISAEEILERYDMDAAHKIAKALHHFEKYLKGDNPVEIVVCSPWELDFLKAEFGDLYEFLTPGIRSPHMASDHQKRIMSAYGALKAGAQWLVMGAQVAKGNPEKGISAEESQQITLNEIEQFFAEQF